MLSVTLSVSLCPLSLEQVIVAASARTWGMLCQSVTIIALWLAASANVLDLFGTLALTLVKQGQSGKKEQCLLISSRIDVM